MKTLRIILGDLKRWLTDAFEGLAMLWAITWAFSGCGFGIVAGAFAESNNTTVRVLALIFCGAGWLVVFFFMIRGIINYFKGLADREEVSKRTDSWRW